MDEQTIQPEEEKQDPVVEAEAVNSKDVEENRVIAAIGYLFILCLIPLLGRPKSEFAQFHGKQGLVLMVAWFCLWIVGWFPILGQILLFVGNIALLGLAVLGFVNALQGKMWEMPFLGKYAKKISLAP